jgi:hypothetical protein
LNGLASTVEPQLLRVRGPQPLNQGPRRVHRGPNIQLLKSLSQGLLRGIGSGPEILGLLDGGELCGIQRQLANGINGRQRQQRDVELVGPLLNGTIHLRRETFSTGGSRRLLALGAETHPVEAEVLDHDLLFGQGGWIQLEPDLIGFDQVASEHERIRYLQCAKVH